MSIIPKELIKEIIKNGYFKGASDIQKVKSSFKLNIPRECIQQM